jgi:diadenosine tetraphosphate (Ap4A) HIT family hydrolase
VQSGGVSCRSCELIERRDRGEAPSWDDIWRTPHWDVVHSYDTSHEGWLVLVLRRHITSMAQLTDDEAVELGRLARDVSAAVEHVLACKRTYIVEFAENPKHDHVHVHVIARPDNLEPRLRGPGIFVKLGVPKSERVLEARREAIAIGVRAELGR